MVEEASYFHNPVEANLLFNQWLMNYLSYGVMVIDTQELIMVANPWAVRQLGFPEGTQLVGQQIDVVLNKLGVHKHDSVLVRVLREGVEYKDATVNYGDKIFTVKSFPIREPLFSNIIGAVYLFQDITNQEQNRNELLRQRDTMQWLMDASTDPIVAIDDKEVTTFVNAAALSYFNVNRDEIIGQPYRDAARDLGTEYDNTAIIRTLRGEPVDERTEINGRVFHLRGFPIRHPETQIIVGSMALYHDITEKEDMHNQLDRLDRLNMVGEIAASIGHEVRNPLTTVKGFLTLLSDKTGSIEAHRDTFSLMIEELDRANQIITEFLSLAKNKIIDMKLMDLNKLLSNLQPMFEADGLVCNMEVGIYRQPIPLIKINEPEIRQLLMNLVKNAFEAMECGGKVSVTTGVHRDEVYVMVTDQGQGMAREVLDKLGDPFFTTKENGTGLGLPVCYRIMERHGGRIQVESEEGKGTTFIAYFPVNPKVEK